MDFQGKVIQFLGETTGTSKAGNPWKKKEWVVETFGQYTHKIKVQCFGDRSDSINLEPGKDYTLYVDLDSREFNGRWYTDVSVYRVEEINGMQGGMNSPQNFQNNYQQPQQGNFNNMPYGGNQGGGSFSSQSFSASVSEESDEDLPF